MQERREDTLFERWRGGDAAALAEVYDLTAPTLLRMALHFVREPAAAEELVQATFLGAIENAAAWDSTRPLLGWLAGILHNQAKWLLRREGRAVDAGRLPERIEPDPLAQAQAAEFTARIDAAIERMPEAYRPVLRLHLKHQFRAAEIAHVLQRPAGTVRKQIVRGLEMLRGALPAGLTLAAMALVTPSRGLAAVREVVLLAGEAAKPVVLGTGGAVLLVGAWTMKKTAIAAACLALLAGVWMWWHSSSDRSVPREAASVVTSQPMPVTAHTGSTGPGDRTEPMTRDIVDNTLAGWRLQGHVRHAGEQTPAMGAHVTAKMVFEGDPEPLAETMADAAGAFTIDLAPLRALPAIDLERVGITLEAWVEGRCQETAQVPLPHRDPERPLLVTQDLELVPGAGVTGRVLAEGGNPVTEAGIQLLPVGRDDGGTARIVGTADSTGRYRLATPLAGSMTLRAGHPAFGAGETHVTVVLGRDVAAPDVVLRPLGSLTGRVTFEDGEPVGELDVVLYAEGAGEHDQSVATVITGADGRFETRTLAPGRYQPRVGPMHDLIDEGAQRWPMVATDQEAVHLVLRGVHLVRLHYEDEKGRPLRPLGIGYGFWEAKHDLAFRAFLAGSPLPHDVEEDSRITGGGSSRPFLVQRGMWLWVHASHGRCRGETLVQTVPPRNVIDAVLRLRSWEPTALLRLLLSSDGKALEDVEVCLNQTRLGEPGSHDLQPERTEKGFVVSWAPGRYRVEVWPKTLVHDFGWFTRFEQEVELRAGAETVLERTLDPGGRVRFTVHLPDPEDRRPIEDFAIYTMESGQWQRGLRLFTRQRRDEWLTGAEVVPGQPITWKTLLAPGRHELTVKSRDHRDAVFGVTIEPRKVADVDVWLQPR